MAENHSERAYRHIRRMLLEGDVAPGARLSYGSIGRDIGISATPVREAVGQLASEGLVELVPQLGAVVRRLTRQEAIELYETREALESYAAGKAALRISDLQLLELAANLKASKELAEAVRNAKRDTADRERADRFHSLDLSFHMTIIEASGNRRMVKTVGDSHILTRIFEANRHGFEVEILDTTLADHEAIYQALAERSAAKAGRAMAQHIINSLSQTLVRDDAGESGERWWASTEQ